MNGTTIGVDVAKSVFEIAVSDRPGEVRERHRLARDRFLGFFAPREAATVVMEACGSSHYWGREIEKLGHRVLLLPPRAVRPYVVGNKTDRTDAKGILEAYRNQDIHPVPVKSLEQQSLTALHRLRSAWVAARTARINTVRGLLREFGFAIPLGATLVVPRVHEILEDATAPLSDALRPSLAGACREIREIEQRIASLERDLGRLGRESPDVALLLTIPGIGLLTATALVAFVGDTHRFPSGRHFASFLGLTPRERSSGLRRRLGAISKRGDAYLRMLLTHGARAVLTRAKTLDHPDRLRAWALRIERERGHNKATIALANKVARIVWVVWTRKEEYRSSTAPAA